mgnify:CR=1 FL=1
MKFHPGYLALAPLAPLGAAVAHAVLMPKKKSAYQPQPDAERAMAYAEKLAAMIRCDTTSYANAYAPEHLIVSMRDAWGIAAKITAAGSVFIGNYSPESAGDYASGTNHTLPTGGWARACSGGNVDSFMRKITFQETRDGLDALAPAITAMAEAEGLDAHANAVRVRMKGGIL